MRNWSPSYFFLFLSLWAAYPVLAETYHLPFLPRMADPSRVGIVRIANHSTTEGQVLVTAIDDSGAYFGPVTLTLDAQAAIEFSSTDLERGDDTLGIVPGVGNGEGDWRLLIESDLDIEPLAYVRTSTGFMDRLHDIAPRLWFYHRVALTAPDILDSTGGTLRLINRDYTQAEVFIVGQDENGDAGSGHVILYLPASSSRSISASELEDGASVLTGRLGDGEGDWRLLVDADRDIHVMSLVTSTESDLTNISSTSIVPRFLIECVGGSPDADDDGIADHCDEEPNTALRPLSACGDGTFVSSPGLNEGLVGDCRALIGFANYQAQSDDLPYDHAVRQWGFGGQRRPELQPFAHGARFDV